LSSLSTQEREGAEDEREKEEEGEDPSSLHLKMSNTNNEFQEVSDQVFFFPLFGVRSQSRAAISPPVLCLSSLSVVFPSSCS
jgi:hypothetical protein